MKERLWELLIEKGCEFEFRPQQDICFCKLNTGFTCCWENCPRVNKAHISDIIMKGVGKPTTLVVGESQLKARGNDAR